MIALKDVSKTIAHHTIFEHVNLVLQPHVIYGLLGRNGAGKTTLLNLIANRQVVTQGSITLDDELLQDNESALQHVYLCNEVWPYSPYHRINQVFEEVKRYYSGFDIQNATAMLNDFGITISKRYFSLSYGQKQELKLVIALNVPADVILFDEPTLGFDANSRDLFYRFVSQSYEQRAQTIVIATHLIAEVEGLIEEAIVLDRGHIVEACNVENIAERSMMLTGTAKALNELIYDSNLKVLSRQTFGSLITVGVRGNLPRELPGGVITQPLDLQHYFIQITGEDDE